MSSFTPINKGQFTLEPAERIEAFEANRGFGVAEAYRQNREQWSDYPLQQIVEAYPLHVDVELSTQCNLHCPMCYTTTTEYTSRVSRTLMDFALYKRIVSECAIGNVFSIRLSLRGESLLHPKFIDCVRFAKQAGIQEVSTLTNGLLLNEDLFEELMHAGMDWITFSFDGLGQTYEQIRYPAKFERALQKIQNYAAIKKSAGAVKPLIKVQTVLPAIEADPEAYYQTFAPVTDMVSVNPLIDFHCDKTNLPKIENFSCPQPYQRLVVGSDGRCPMCANDEYGHIIVGDAAKQDIQDIWQGKRIQAIRDAHKRRLGFLELHPCQQCSLPLMTYTENLGLNGRDIAAEKYRDNSVAGQTSVQHRVT